jgi:hypothetical protein
MKHIERVSIKKGSDDLRFANELRREKEKSLRLQTRVEDIYHDGPGSRLSQIYAITLKSYATRKLLSNRVHTVDGVQYRLQPTVSTFLLHISS